MEEPIDPTEPDEDDALVDEPETPLTPEEEGEEEEAGLTEEQAQALFQKAQEDEDKRSETILDKLDREAKRHRDRLAQILEEDVLRLVPCELCRADMAGWVDSTVAIPHEVKERVRIQIGDREPENWLPDAPEHSHRCAQCDGQGEVLTGSRKHGQEVLPCVECSGRGWVGDRAQGPLRVTTTTAASGVATDGPAAPSADDPAVAALRARGLIVIDPRAGQ